MKCTCTQRPDTDPGCPAHSGEAEVPRHLLVALQHATRAFRDGDLAALGTINEYLQPLVDAAIAYCNREIAAEAALTAEIDALRSRMHEAEAELAAYRGLPAGALNTTWAYENPRWVKVISGSVKPVEGKVTCERLSVDVRSSAVEHNKQENGGQKVMLLLRGSANNPPPRNGMRFAEDWLRRRNAGVFIRASGDTICDRCSRHYRNHPDDPELGWSGEGEAKAFPEGPVRRVAGEVVKIQPFTYMADHALCRCGHPLGQHTGNGGMCVFDQQCACRCFDSAEVNDASVTADARVDDPPTRARYREARERSGLTIGQAVRWLGWLPPRGGVTADTYQAMREEAREHLAAIEAGTVEPIPAAIARMCDAYRVNENWLRGGPGRDLHPSEIRGIEKLAPADAAIVMDLLRSSK